MLVRRKRLAHFALQPRFVLGGADFDQAAFSPPVPFGAQAGHKTADSLINMRATLINVITHEICVFAACYGDVLDTLMNVDTHCYLQRNAVLDHLADLEFGGPCSVHGLSE